LTEYEPPDVANWFNYRNYIMANRTNDAKCCEKKLYDMIIVKSMHRQGAGANTQQANKHMAVSKLMSVPWLAYMAIIKATLMTI
jgi:hypothetical protein